MASASGDDGATSPEAPEMSDTPISVRSHVHAQNYYALGRVYAGQMCSAMDDDPRASQHALRGDRLLWLLADVDDAESLRDFIYAEVWSSPGLARRARYLIALAGSVVTGADDETFDIYVEGALKSGELSVTELREAALHMGPYGGWPKAKRLDRAVTRAHAMSPHNHQARPPICRAIRPPKNP